MSDESSIEISIPNKSEYVGVIRLAIAGIANRMRFTIEDIEDIKIAVSEACTNAVQYAYGANQSGRIYISCLPNNDNLEITIKDEGKGFDINNITQGRSGTSKDGGLGLGITFIRSLMDDVTFDSVPGKGTMIKMSKKATAAVPNQALV